MSGGECCGFGSMSGVEEPAGIEPESDDEEAGETECSENEGGPE